MITSVGQNTSPTPPDPYSGKNRAFWNQQNEIGDPKQACSTSCTSKHHTLDFELYLPKPDQLDKPCESDVPLRKRSFNVYEADQHLPLLEEEQRGASKKPLLQQDLSIDKVKASEAEQVFEFCHQPPVISAPNSTSDMIDQSQLGYLIGSGGRKNVYAFGETQAVAVLKPGYSPLLLTHELSMLCRLKNLGLPTVNPMSVYVNGHEGFLMKRFHQSSKKFIRCIKGRSIKVINNTLRLSQQNIDELKGIKKTLIDKKVSIIDLQFLIEKDGCVVIADPLVVEVGNRPRKMNLKMINTLIKLAEKNDVQTIP